MERLTGIKPRISTTFKVAQYPYTKDALYYRDAVTVINKSINLSL
jgi:hypothetical protein